MKVASIVLICFLTFLGCRTKNTAFDKFDSLFTVSDKDTLFLPYNPSKEAIGDGADIPSEYFRFFKFPAEFIEYDSSECYIKAVKKHIIDNKHTLYCISFNDKSVPGRPYFACLYLYDKSNNKMGDPIEAAYSAGGSSCEYHNSSWLFDPGKNGKPKLVTWIYRCCISAPEGAVSQSVDTLDVKTWSDTGFKNTFPENPVVLRQKLEIPGKNCE